MPRPTALPGWMSELPTQDGFVHISRPRRFAHDEEKYDEQYASDPGNLKVGRGLIRLLDKHGADTSAPALEFGCGTGLLSLGLAEQSPYPLTIFTDPSPTFLRITQAKIRHAGFDESRLCYAVLMGEEVDRLPEKSLSLIVLRSTLHHILDVDDFIRDAARALKAGGVLTFEEPCQEGYVLMGAMLQFLPAVAKAAGKPLSEQQAQQVDLFARTMAFYARRDLDKREAEDKHLFRVDEIMRTAQRSGLEMEFIANRSYEAFEHDPAPVEAFLDYMRRWLGTHAGVTSKRMREGRKWYLGFMRSYAKYCMSWNDELMAAFDEHMPVYCTYVEQASMGHAGPYLHGVFIGRKS